VRAAYCGSR